MMNTNITYEGVVTVTTKKNGAIFHNAGSNRLFEIFANFLTGGGYSMMSPPGYLMLYNCNGGIDTILEGTVIQLQASACLSFLSPLRREVSVRNGVKNASFSTTLYKNDLINNDVYSQSSNYCIALVDSNQEYILAVAAIDSDIVGSISGGGEAIIKWEMYLTNAEVQ